MQEQATSMAQSSGVVGFIARRLFGTQPEEEDSEEEVLDDTGVIHGLYCLCLADQRTKCHQQNIELKHVGFWCLDWRES